MAELSGIAQRVAASEAVVPNLRSGCEKQIIWSGSADQQTPISVVFIHGFSASLGEIRPVPDIVAKALGANLFFTRLTGHGQDGAAFGKATLEEWRADVREALDIAQAIGERVIVIGCSTGCTLTTLALAEGAKPVGVVFVSPNFGLRHKLGQFLLDLPGVRHFGHFIAGKERTFPVLSGAHARYWTTTYPISAVYPMGAAVAAARKIDYGKITTPALIAMNDVDQVISPKAAKSVMRRWGGPIVHVPLIQTEDDDKMGHLMAGDVFSPNQTVPLAARILDWARPL